MNPTSYELHATIKQHQQDLQREAQADRLLANLPPRFWRPPGAPVERLLARTGRWLIAVGIRLEARYASMLAAQKSHS
jgi:hypothetical protein